MKKYLFVALFISIVASSIPAESKSEIHLSIGEVFESLRESEFGDSATLITRKRIEKTDKNSSADLIDGINTISVVQSGVFGGNASVYLRGLKNEYSAIMIDGIEINDPMTTSRSADISAINPIYLESVEILNNPQSGLYGSDALGGIINFITVPRERKRSIAFGYDSNGVLNSGIVFSEKNEKISFLFSGSRLYADGLSKADSKSGDPESDVYENNSLAAYFKGNVSENSAISVYYRTIGIDNDLDNGAYNQDPNYASYNRFNISKLEFSNSVSDWWNWSLSADYLYSKREYDNLPDSSSSDTLNSWYKGKNFNLKLRNSFKISEVAVLDGGVEYKREEGSSYSYSNGSWGPSESKFNEKSLFEKAVYLKSMMALGADFSSSIGIREIDNEVSGRSSAYSLYSSYALSGKTLLKASWGKAFKTPSLYQLYSSFGNESLKPDKSQSFDAGFLTKILSSKVQIDGSYFRTISENMIDFNITSWKYENTGKARIEGFEVGIKAKFSEKYSAAIQYTRLSAVNMKQKSSLLRRAKNNFSISLNYSPNKKCSVNFLSKYRGSRYDLDENYQKIKMDPYVKSDIYASYSFNELISAHAGVKNIFNSKYEDLYGYFSPRRSVYVRLETGF